MRQEVGERLGGEDFEPLFLTFGFGGGDPLLTEGFFARSERSHIFFELIHLRPSLRFQARLTLFQRARRRPLRLAAAAAARAYVVVNFSHSPFKLGVFFALALLLFQKLVLFPSRLLGGEFFLSLLFVEIGAVSLFDLLFARALKGVVRDEFPALERGAYPLHLPRVERDEEIGHGGEHARADDDEYERGDYRFAHGGVGENGIIRLARHGIGDKPVALIDKGEYDRGDYAADGGDHDLEVVGKALYPRVRFELLGVESVRHDARLHDILRTEREVIDKQGDDEKGESLPESQKHDERRHGVAHGEDKAALARAQLGDDDGREYYPRGEAHGSYRLNYARKSAVAQLIGADPGQKRGEHALEPAEELGHGHQPELLVFGEYLHAVRELYLVDVALGQNHALVRAGHYQKPEQKSRQTEQGHENAVSPDIFQRLFAEEDEPERGEQKLHDARTEIAEKFRNAHDARALFRIGTYHLRDGGEGVGEQRLGDREEVEKDRDEDYLHDAQRLGRHRGGVEGNDGRGTGNEPGERDRAYQAGYARPEHIGAEFAQRRVGVVLQHAHKGSFYHAHDVGDDEEPHDVCGAQPVDGGDQKTGGRHLNVIEERTVGFDAHGSHRISRNFLICHGLALLRTLPIAAHREPHLL